MFKAKVLLLLASGSIAALVAMDFCSFTNFLYQASRASYADKRFLVSWQDPVKICAVGMDAGSHKVIDEFVDIIRHFKIEVSAQFNKNHHECLRESEIIVNVEPLNLENFSVFVSSASVINATGLIKEPPSRFAFSTFFHGWDSEMKSLVWINAIALEERDELREAAIQELFHSISFGLDINKPVHAYSILHEINHPRPQIDSSEKINTSPDGLCRFDLQLLHIISRKRSLYPKEKNLIFIPLADIGITDYLLSLIPAQRVIHEQHIGSNKGRIVAQNCSWTFPRP